MTEREKSLSACRQLLAPSWRNYWDRGLSNADRKWFLQCADLNRSGRTMWSDLTQEQQRAVLRAYGQFMDGGRISAQPILPRSV